MNKEQIKLKIQRLVNQYNVANYVHVIKESGILLKKLPNNLFLMNLIGSSFQKIGESDQYLNHMAVVGKCSDIPDVPKRRIDCYKTEKKLLKA